MSTAASSRFSRFFLLACAGFASMCSMRITDAMLPELAAQFGTTTGAAASVVSVFVIAYGLCQLIYGPLGDRYGKTKVVRVAVGAAAIINLAIAFSPSLSAMTGLRLLAGVAAAGIVPLCLAFIGDAVPYAERQTVLAQFLTGLISGMIVGQWAGGVFASLLGWSWAFVCLAILFSGVAIAMWRNLPVAPGVEVSSATFAQQLRRVLALPWARTIGWLALAEGAFVFSSLVFIPSFLHSRFDLQLYWAGALVSLFGVGGLAYATKAKFFVSRFGERGLSLYGGLSQGAGLLLLLVAPHWSLALPACFLFGIGFYMLHNTLQTHATQMAPEARGTAVALFAALLFLGQAIGISAAGVVTETIGVPVVIASSLLAMPLLGFWFASALRKKGQMV